MSRRVESLGFLVSLPDATSRLLSTSHFSCRSQANAFRASGAFHSMGKPGQGFFLSFLFSRRTRSTPLASENCKRADTIKNGRSTSSSSCLKWSHWISALSFFFFLRWSGSTPPFDLRPLASQDCKGWVWADRSIWPWLLFLFSTQPSFLFCALTKERKKRKQWFVFFVSFNKKNLMC